MGVLGVQVIVLAPVRPGSVSRRRDAAASRRAGLCARAGVSKSDGAAAGRGAGGGCAGDGTGSAAVARGALAVAELDVHELGELLRVLAREHGDAAV